MSGGSGGAYHLDRTNAMGDTADIPYDEQAPEQRAVTRHQWDVDIRATREALNYAERFASKGRAYVEAASDESVIRRSGAR
ncbi:hypothetical protein ASF35_05140 [Aeromicrobium sp. Leaf291]|nr:hypothetical protein ASF35_05140 [Aeromicrobium sp. Leaf291]